MRSSSARRSGPTTSVVRSPSRAVSTSARRSAGVGQAHHPARVDVERGEQLPHHAGQVLAQPRHAAELQRVRDLVQRDPAQQLVALGVERAGGAGQVGGDEEQPGGRLRVEDRELVLAQDALGQQPGDGADLEREDHPAAALTAGPNGPMPLPSRPATGSSTVFSEVRLLSIQTVRSTGSGCGSGANAFSPV